MKAIETSFRFMTSTLKLEIPYFQRSYVWKEDNWKELYDNLKDEKQSHYLGSIVLKLDPSFISGQTPTFSVIDGQQRLTTLSILMRACYDKTDLSSLSEIDRCFKIAYINQIISYNENGKTYLKIKHSRVDAEDFNSVINGKFKDKLDSIILDSEAKKKVPATKSEIVKCYKFFCKQFDSDPTAKNKIWDLLLSDAKKILVKIDLDQNENEQVIFDSVNSSGVKLTSAEIIKNSIFKKLYELCGDDTDKQNQVIKLYTDKWEKIFIINKENDSELTEFWNKEKRIGRIRRDNLEILLHSIAIIYGFFNPDEHNLSDLSVLYKSYLKDLDYNKLCNFVEEISKYGILFRKYFSYNSDQTFSYKNHIERVINILNVCDINTLNPYILYLLKKYPEDEKGNLNPTLLVILKNIETMVLRYVLCNVSTKNLNKNCVQFIKDTNSIKQEIEANATLISDSNILKALCSLKKNDIPRLILFWIELYHRSQNNSFDFKDHIAYPRSLEHIMPQSWEDNWGFNNIPFCPPSGDNSSYNDDPKIQRLDSIYEIGNMAILTDSLNSKLSNNKLEIKINEMKKFADFKITKDVIQKIEEYKTWNEKTIRDRTLEIYNEFINLWPLVD